MKKVRGFSFLCVTLSLLLLMTSSVFAVSEAPKAGDNGIELVESVKALNNTTVEVVFAGEVKDKKVDFAINEMYGAKKALEIINVSFSEDNRIATITTGSQKAAALYRISIKAIHIKHLGKIDEISKLFAGRGITPEPSPVSIVYAIAVNGTRVDVAFDMEVDFANAKFNIINSDGTQALGVTGYSIGSDRMTVSIYTTPQQAGRIYMLRVTDIKTLDGRVSGTLDQIFAGVGTPMPSLEISSAIAVNNTRVDVMFNIEVDLSSASITFTDMTGIHQTLTVTGYEVSEDKKTAAIYTSPQSAGMLYKVVISGAKTMDGNTANDCSRLFAGSGLAPDQL
ncbi:MAG: S-layer domain protein [Clostridia bacterium]|nr:S-layer domain protein [Clostridia bacterium]